MYQDVFALQLGHNCINLKGTGFVIPFEFFLDLLSEVLQIIGLECSPNFFCQLAELGPKLGPNIFALGIAREHWGTQQGGFEEEGGKIRK